MTHPVLLATLLMAFNLATFAAHARNPAFQARQAGREAEATLDWQIAVAAYTYRRFTFFETVDKVAELGVDRVEGFNFQKIGKEIPGNLNPLTMSDEDLRKVRDKLQRSGVTLIALYYGSFPADEASCRTIFENSKELGVEYFVSEPKPERLPMLDKLAREYGMLVGLHGHDKKHSPHTWHPELVAKQCQTFSPAIGAFSDTGHWIRSELFPSEGAEILKDRIVGFELHDLNAFAANGHDVPLGTGVGALPEMLETLARVKAGPVLLSIECSFNPEDPSEGVKKSIDFLDRQAIRLARSKASGAVDGDNTGWVSLFNGKDLTGWHRQKERGMHGSGGLWGVDERGVLFGEQDPPGSGNGGLLLSDERFARFELELSLRPDWGPDSGIFVRTDERGYGWQIYVDHHDHGNVGHIRLETKPYSVPFRPFGFSRIKPDEPALAMAVDHRTTGWPEGVYEETCTMEQWLATWKTDDWNRLRVRCTGKELPRIEVWLNGLKVCAFNAETTKHPGFDRARALGVVQAEGSIGLQVHGGKNWPEDARVFWKDVRVRKLSSSE